MIYFQNHRLKKVVSFILCIIGVILFFKYIFGLCWPLLIAIIIVSSLYDRLWNLEIRTGINRSIVIVILVILGVLTLVVVSGGILYVFSQICVNHVSNIADMENKCFYCVDEICYRISELSGIRFDDVARTVHQEIGQMGDKCHEILLPKLLEKSMVSFKMIASVFAVLMITGILTILLMKEYGEWRNFIYRRDVFLPVCRIWKQLQNSLKEYVKAEVTIMSAITVIVLIGAYLTTIEHPIFIALLTGFLDMLPFIGTGLVLFPLGVWFVIEGKYMSVLVIFLVYIACVVTRQFLEPKLIGNGMQISAAGVLIAIFAGLKLYGVIGILFGPLTLMILIECYREIYDRKNE